MKDDARRKETNKGELGLKKELGLADAVSLEIGAMICGGLPNIDPSNLTPLFPKGIASVAVAAGLLFFAYMGANYIIDMGAEIKDAGRTIPRSFALSIPTVVVLYSIIGLVAVGVLFILALGMESPPGFALFAAWMAAGAVYYYLRNRYLRTKRKIDLNDLPQKGILGHVSVPFLRKTS